MGKLIYWVAGLALMVWAYFTLARIGWAFLSWVSPLHSIIGRIAFGGIAVLMLSWVVAIPFVLKERRRQL